MNKLNKEIIKEKFKNHVADLKILDENTQTLTWKEPGTRAYHIDFVFFKNTLFVTGDLRSAVFNTTWATSWDCMNGWRIGLDYFASKLDTITYGKYSWDDKVAKERLKSHYRYYFDELTDEEFDEIIEFLEVIDIEDEIDFNSDDIPHKQAVKREYLLQMCLVMHCVRNSFDENEFVYEIQNSIDFEDFNDFWEWGYDCGRVLNSDIEIYLIALQMAYDQLSKKKAEVCVND